MQTPEAVTNYRDERRQRAEAIIEKLKVNLGAVLAHFPVELAYLHGSVARGSPEPESDIDLAIVLTEPLPEAAARLKLEFDLQAAIEDACGLKRVDVRTINHAPLLALGEIVQAGLCLYARDQEKKADFESLVRRKYFDFRPQAEQMQKAFLEHLRQKGLGHG